jgi:hypothetical protein
MQPAHLAAGLRYGASALRRRLLGWRRFPGPALDACIGIIRACWNGRYLANSVGGYREFWARDFGISIDALLRLGFGAEALATLEYALQRYRQAGTVTTTIAPSGVCFSFPDAPSPDSLALLLYSLRQAKARDLVAAHKPFLEREAGRLVARIVDPATGLVRRGVRCSGMRDYAVRESSCYDNAMLALLQRELRLLKLANPLKAFNYPRLLRKAFWTGTHFACDLRSRHVTADANIMPFWTGLSTEKGMLRRAMAAIDKAGLARTLPLSYIGKDERERMLKLEFLVPAWERDACWSNIGLLALPLLRRTNQDAFRTARDRYREVVERHGTLFECYEPRALGPYRSWAYLAADGMLWSANLAALLG